MIIALIGAECLFALAAVVICYSCIVAASDADRQSDKNGEYERDGK